MMLIFLYERHVWPYKWTNSRSAFLVSYLSSRWKDQNSPFPHWKRLVCWWPFVHLEDQTFAALKDYLYTLCNLYNFEWLDSPVDESEESSTSFWLVQWCILYLNEAFFGENLLWWGRRHGCFFGSIIGWTTRLPPTTSNLPPVLETPLASSVGSSLNIWLLFFRQPSRIASMLAVKWSACVNFTIAISASHTSFTVSVLSFTALGRPALIQLTILRNHATDFSSLSQSEK